MAPKPISAEQPFIIHQETEAKTVTEKKKAAMPSMGWFKKEQPKAPQSQVKVELETFGPKIEEKKEPAVSKTEAPKQRIIHYRDVEIPTPFGKVQSEPFKSPEEQPGKEIAPRKIETPAVKPEPPKPFDAIQTKPEPPEPVTPAAPMAPAAKPEPSAKSTEPTIINLDSFGVSTEKNEVKLEGNTINLKKQNPNQ